MTPIYVNGEGGQGMLSGRNFEVRGRTQGPTMLYRGSRPFQRLGTVAGPHIKQLQCPSREMVGGESGIRTRVTVSRKHTFQACAFNHSATSPSLHVAPAGSPRGLGRCISLGAAMRNVRNGRRPTSGRPSPAPEPSKQQARGSSSRSRAECQAITAVYSLCRRHGISRAAGRSAFEAPPPE